MLYCVLVLTPQCGPIVDPMTSTRINNHLFTLLLVTLALLAPPATGAEAGTETGAEDSEDSGAASVSFEGSNWQLVQLTVLGGYVFTPDDPDRYVINFRGENRLTGRSDCNQLSGLWQQDAATLRFDPFLSSRNLCPPGSLHNNLVLYLQDVVAYEVRADQLILTTTTEGVEIVFASRR